jgi:hypothetical protein
MIDWAAAEGERATWRHASEQSCFTMSMSINGQAKRRATDDEVNDPREAPAVDHFGASVHVCSVLH